MAKERADKPRKEKAEKADKISRDKVKKHKKEKKAKHDDDIEMVGGDDEPSQVEDSPVKSSGSSVDITLDSVVKSKKSKKEKKKSKKVAEEGETTTSFNDMSLPLRPASKDSKDSDDDDGGGGAPLFAIDTNPTPVNLESLATGENRVPKPQHKGHNPPPSGLNRQARRRIRLVEQQREKIQKKLGVPVGSSEKQDEVQAKLDAWVADLDGKTEIRMKKKRQRREKNAAKVRNKRGKILTGERLKDRQKQLRKVEKKEKKRNGISATNEA